MTKKKNANTILESGIEPLVEILNGIKGIQTQYSCHGHIGRPQAWVIFSSESIEFSYNLWAKLKLIMTNNLQMKLSYYWTIRPRFVLYNGLPGFDIEGNPIRFLTSLRKKYLLNDIKKLNEFLFVGEYKKDEIPNHYHHDQYSFPISISPTPAGIFRLAVGTSTGVRGNLSTASVTFDELCHELIYHMSNCRSNRNKNNHGPLLVFAALEHSFELWHIAETLRTLYFEKAYSFWPEIEGYFLKNQVVLRINATDR
jgi:hypothetical protein